jgi:hypothetical protein
LKYVSGGLKAVDEKAEMVEDNVEDIVKQVAEKESSKKSIDVVVPENLQDNLSL